MDIILCVHHMSIVSWTDVENFCNEYLIITYSTRAMLFPKVL